MANLNPLWFRFAMFLKAVDEMLEEMLLLTQAGAMRKSQSESRKSEDN